MTRATRLEHQFVHYIPDRLKPGILYVSIDYATAAHLCCCGCGEEVVTPFTPTDWQMTFDGETISLWPSIGNWNYACRSHYVIRQGGVIEASAWTDQEIATARRRAKARKANAYAESDSIDDEHFAPHKASSRTPPKLWSRIKGWMTNS